MQIDIIAPGRVKERYLRDAIDEYSKRLSRYCKLNIIEVADEKTPDHASEGVDRQIKAREGERIAKHLKDGAFVIALAINGKQLSSRRCRQNQRPWIAWHQPYSAGHRRFNRP